MEHGIVTSVNYNSGIVYCNVRASRVQMEYERVPLMKPHSGFIQVPTQGEKVTMEQLEDGTRFISNVMSREGAYPSSMEEGELTIQLDEQTEVRFEEQSNGDYDLHLGASGDVYINGTKQ